MYFDNSKMDINTGSQNNISGVQCDNDISSNFQMGKYVILRRKNKKYVYNKIKSTISGQFLFKD